MLSWFVVFMFVAVMCHFIYEGIVAPSLRMNLRYRLFAIRDELRELISEKDTDVPIQAFKTFQDDINHSVSNLGSFHVSTLFQVRRAMKLDKELEAGSKAEIDLVRSVENPEFSALRKRFLSVLLTAFVANSAGLFAWVVPAVLAQVFLGKVKKLVLLSLQMPASFRFYGRVGMHQAC